MISRVVKASRWRLWILGSLAAIVISMGALVGIAALLFPWILSHPEKIQTFLSEQLQQPVFFKKLSGEWRANGPIFSLDELKIGEGDLSSLNIERAELAFDFYAFLRRGRSWHELNIVAPTIDIAKTADGQWQVQQWSGPNGKNSTFELSSLKKLGTVGLRDASINIVDAKGERQLHLRNVDARVTKNLSGRQLGLRFRIEGGSAPIVQVACTLNDSFATGRCFLRGNELRIGEWLSTWPIRGVGASGGTLNIEAWLELERFEMQKARVELVAKQVALLGTHPIQLPNGQLTEPRLSRDKVALSFDWSRQIAGGWKLSVLEAESLADFSEQAPARIHIAQSSVEGVTTTNVSVESLRLERVLPWLALSDALTPIAAGTLLEAAPEGEIKHFWLASSTDGKRQLGGKIAGFGLHSTRKIPAISGLNGDLSGDESAIFLQLEAAKTEVKFPGVFRNPLPVSLDPMLIGWLPLANGWRLSIDQFGLQGEDVGIEGQLQLDFLPNGGLPVMDAIVRVRPGSVPAAKAVWPMNVMPAATVKWLDRALLSGQIDYGMVLIHGDLDDWPFAANTGRFDARATVSNTEISFAPGWPKARLSSAQLQFVGNRMSIAVPEADLFGNPVSDVSAEIETLRDPLLELRLKSASAGEPLLNLLRHSPLQEKFGAQLAGVTIAGAANVDLSLSLPLGKRLGDKHVTGQVVLDNADLRDQKWNLHFEKASGSVRFSEGGFSADALNVNLKEDTAQLDIATGSFTASKGDQLEASLSGKLSAASLASRFPVLDTYLDRLPGKAQWDMNLAIAKSAVDQIPSKRLTVRSDLRGMALDLPAPLRKDAETSMPFELAADLSTPGAVLDIKLGRLARMHATMATETMPFAGHLAFLGEMPDDFPKAGLHISGSLPAIDFGGWVALGSASPGNGEVPVTANVQAEELSVMGRAFANTHLDIRNDGDLMRVSLKGDGIDGSFDKARVNADLRGITARFKTLHWPEAAPRAATRSLDPANIPPLHIWVGDLKLGTAAFGEARIETRPTEAGLRIEELNTRSPTLTMRASGHWALQGKTESTLLDITFSAEDIGQMLQSLGYGSVIRGGQTVARLNGQWTGSPAQFGLQRVNGTLEGEVGEGRILDVEPGAGRLFGLISFASIPRRLSLDFSDFFKSGMAFDSIKGSFTLTAGNAHTEDLKIVAPSAEIRIKGRAGLVARDYDQEMIVIPKVRSALPLVGAVAAGPVGAMVGVIAQDMLRKPLDEIVAARYSVHGTWNKPDITLIAKEKQKLQD